MSTKVIEITNWKDLLDQFGMDAKDGLLSAKQIHRELEKQVRQSDTALDKVFVKCSKKGEAVACFTFARDTDSYVVHRLYYDYNGTAN